MARPPNGGEGTGLSPDDAFTLLGNETRIELLQALWEAYDPYAEDNTVTFSDLYDKVELDDTGNFNYHLGQLTGHFVRQTDDGYELTEPGFQVVRAVVAGAATEDPTLGPNAVDESCPRCDSPVEVSYEDGTTQVRCSECEGLWSQGEGIVLIFGLPPQGLRSRTPDELLDDTISYTIHRKEALRDGVCPECGGTVDSSLSVCEDHAPRDDLCDACGSYFLGEITHVCTACKFAFRAPSWDPVHHHPALVAFYHDHGIDHEHNSWEAMRRSFDWREEFLSANPPRIRVVVPFDGEELHATIDETGTVVDVSVDQ